MRKLTLALALLLITIGVVHASYTCVDNDPCAPRLLTATASLDFDFSGGSLTIHSLTMTVTGAEAGDVVALGIPTAVQGTDISCTGFVSAANTVTVRCIDVAASNLNPAAATFRANVWKH